MSNLNILAIGTEWGSGKGGLSTLNRELCKGLAKAGHSVVCLTLSATEQERIDAAANGVRLVSAREGSVISRLASNLKLNEDRDEVLSRLPEPLCDNYRPDIIVGHGLITGPAAVHHANESFPGCARIHFVHVAPSEIEWFKERPNEPDAAVRSERKERAEREMAYSANLVVAVGPRLRREIELQLSGYKDHPHIHQLNPWLDDEPVERHIPAGLQCLFLGRAEDLHLKGLDIAARALGVYAQSNRARDLLFMVRGADPGDNPDLKANLTQLCGNPNLDIRLYPFTSDPTGVSYDLMRASLVLMPSQREGFGLVGLEALNTSTPVLISQKSGLAELLEDELEPELYNILTLDVSENIEATAALWMDRISMFLANKKDVFQMTKDAREKLYAKLNCRVEIEKLLAMVEEHCQ